MIVAIFIITISTKRVKLLFMLYVNEIVRKNFCGILCKKYLTTVSKCGKVFLFRDVLESEIHVMKS